MAGIQIRENEPMSRHTSWKVGGAADFYCHARSISDVEEALAFARERGIPWRVMGFGSNVLVSDAGIRGLVVEYRSDRWTAGAAGQPILEALTGKPLPVTEGQPVSAYAEGGVSLIAFARGLSKAGWAGMEWAIGVPGSIGGAIRGNAGANGGDIKGRARRVLILNARREHQVLESGELDMGYRTSRWKGPNASGDRNSEVILAAELAVEREEPERILDRLESYNSRRKSTQPADLSAGSVFKNPPGDYSGRLIESAGLKGYRIGQAQISDKHANFFINLGGATAGEIRALMKVAQDRVREQFGIKLELEVEIIGDW